MKNLIVILMILFGCQCYTFAQQIGPIAMAPGIAFAQNAGYSLGSVIAEMSVVESFTKQGYSLSHGFFQQGALNTGLNILSSTPNLKATIYPNPTTDQAILAIHSTQHLAAAIQVIDMTGKIIFNLSTLQVNPPAIAYELQTASWPTGTYCILLTTAENRRTLLLVKN